MPDIGPDYIRKAKSSQKVPALKSNGNVVFTIPFIAYPLLSKKKKYPQGTTGIVTRLHTGLFGEIIGASEEAHSFRPRTACPTGHCCALVR
jgi:hypothetical protein